MFSRRDCVHKESTVYITVNVTIHEGLRSQGTHCLYFSESHPPGGVVFTRNPFSIL